MKPKEYRIMHQVEDTLWWYRGMEAITRRVIERFYARGQGIRILDAGCGTGGAMGYLADYGTASGLDFSPLALRFSRQRGRERLARGTVTELPFRSNSFELVVSFDVLCVRGIDDAPALREFRRVLVPGGRAILRLPAYNWLRGAHDAAGEVRHRYTVGEMRRRMCEAGFTVEHSSYANMWLFPLAAAKRWAEHLFPRQSGSDLFLPMGPLNGLFRRILSSEAPFVAGRGLAFGLSLIIAGRKPQRIQ